MSSFRINLYYMNTFVPCIYRDLTNEERTVIKEDIDEFFNMPPTFHRDYAYFEVTEEDCDDSVDNSYFMATYRSRETNGILPLSRDQKVWATTRRIGTSLYYNKETPLYYFEFELL